MELFSKRRKTPVSPRFSYPPPKALRGADAVTQESSDDLDPKMQLFYRGLAVLSGNLLPVADVFVSRMKHEFSIDGKNRSTHQMLLVYSTSAL